MKITKVDVYMLDAGEQRWQRKPIICRIHTDEGIYGDGEAGIALGIGSTGAFGMVKDLAGLIIGMDPMNVEVIWNKMFKSSFWGMGGGAIVFAGISAIDIALWDIKGKVLGVPCYQLLGGKFRSKMRSYASQLQFGWCDRIGPYGKPEEYAEITQYALDQGYDAVKIDFTQIGPDATHLPKSECEGIPTRKFIDMVEARMKAVRDNCGWDFDIIVEKPLPDRRHQRGDHWRAVRQVQGNGVRGANHPHEPHDAQGGSRQDQDAHRQRRAHFRALALYE